jgi:allantoinase
VPAGDEALAAGDFFQAWGGIASLQWSLPAVWTATRGSQPAFHTLAQWLCARGRRGWPVWSVARERWLRARTPTWWCGIRMWSFEVRPEATYHRHKVSPYHGRMLYGAVERTYLRGTLVAERGTVKAGATGKTLLGRE